MSNETEAFAIMCLNRDRNVECTFIALFNWRANLQHQYNLYRVEALNERVDFTTRQPTKGFSSSISLRKYLYAILQRMNRDDGCKYRFLQFHAAESVKAWIAFRTKAMLPAKSRHLVFHANTPHQIDPMDTSHMPLRIGPLCEAAKLITYDQVIAGSYRPKNVPANPAPAQNQSSGNGVFGMIPDLGGEPDYVPPEVPVPEKVKKPVDRHCMSVADFAKKYA